MKHYPNGAFVSFELLNEKYVGHIPSGFSVKLVCEHIHAIESGGSIENINNHKYQVLFDERTIIETDSFVEALGVYEAA